MSRMASQSYLDTHLLETIYRETTVESITIHDLFLPGGQATRCQDTTYCESWVRQKHGWPRPANRLLFEEAEVVPLS